MGNKYYDQLVNNDSHFEITFNDFEEFITFIRPDKLHVKDLMTQLRLEFNPSAVNFPFFKIKDFKRDFLKIPSYNHLQKGIKTWNNSLDLYMDGFL